MVLQKKKFLKKKNMKKCVFLYLSINMQILSQKASIWILVSKKFALIQRVTFLIVRPYFRREFRWNLKFLIACYSSKQGCCCCFFFPLLSSPLSHAAQPEFPLHCANAGHGHRTLQESRSQHLGLLSSSTALTSTCWILEQHTVTANTHSKEQPFLKQQAAEWA